jgi:hypothetical protein
MPISQERMESIKVPEYTFTDHVESLGKKILIKISEGLFKNLSFTLYDLRVVEDGNDAMLQFSYDVIDQHIETDFLDPSMTENDIEMELENTIAAIVNEILIRSVNELKD